MLEFWTDNELQGVVWTKTLAEVSLAAQAVVPEPVPLAAHKNILDMQNLRPFSRTTTESKSAFKKYLHIK